MRTTLEPVGLRRSTPSSTAPTPETNIPAPTLTSANPCTCVIRLPDRALSPLASISDSTSRRRSSTPWLRTISGLSPLARRARPISVLRNTAIVARTATTMAASSIELAMSADRPGRSMNGEKIVSTPTTLTVGVPSTRSVTLNNAMFITSPAISTGMRSSRWSAAVVAPTTAPAATAAAIATSGWWTPLAVRMTPVTAPPRAKLPSTDRSKSWRIRSTT